MLKIRLRRIGAIRQPHYRIVVADARAPRDGAFIETLGHYNPRTHPATIQVDVGKYEEWKHKGAQPTDAVERLVRQFNRAARQAAQAGEGAPEGSAASRRTRTASGKGVSKPAPVAVAEPEPVAESLAAEAPMAEAVAESAAEDAALNSTDEPVLEAVTETPAGAAEGSADTDTAV